MGNTVLITGGDGYLGQLLTASILRTSTDSVVIWARADTPEEKEKKRDQLTARYNDNLSRVHFHFGQLQDASPFASIDSTMITHIIHSAAVTRFNVEEKLADDVNVDGTRKVLVFAQQCENLQHYNQISTVYSSGKTQGVIHSEYLETPASFANHYERSKYEAECILREEFDHLPWSIYRLATIIAHDNSGSVEQYNVFHNTIRLLYHGLISLLPGDEKTPLYFVTGEFCRDAILQNYACNTAIKKTFHVCHSLDESLTLGALVDVIFETFSSHSSFQKRRVLKPLLSDKYAFMALSEAIKKGVGGVLVQQAVSSIEPFADQLFIHKDIEISHFDNLSSPDMNTLTSAVCNYLIETQWGAKTQGDIRA